MRLVFGIEYDGTDWNGWQTQRCNNTVQDTIESALARFANHAIKTTCAGRTDSGVHAKGQVIHLDTELERPVWSWIRGTNSFLPNSVRLKWGKEVSEEFHARFSARSRIYTYSICNTPIESPLANRFHTWIFKKLNDEKMKKASVYLIGKHDFSSFRSSECQANSPVKNIKRCDITRSGSYLSIEIEADGFLHHMVRNIVGCLYEIGIGERSEDWIKVVLKSRDRSTAGKTLPPQGLCFKYVDYGRDLFCGQE